MSEINENCLYIKKARELAKEVKQTVPIAIFTSRLLSHALAQIRHDCTNYDEILNRLSEATVWYDDGKYADDWKLEYVCYWQGICTHDIKGPVQECPSIDEGYWIIKVAANNIAKRLLEEYSQQDKQD